MAIYTVHTNSNDFRLIREGSSTFALIAPPIWLTINRLWLELFGYFVIMCLFFAIAYKLQSGVALLLTGLPGIYLWLEGNQLLRAKLERGGWKLTDLVEGGDFESAEAKHLSKNLTAASHSTPVLTKEKTIAEKPAPKHFHHTGLFPE